MVPTGKSVFLREIEQPISQPGWVGPLIEDGSYTLAEGDKLSNITGLAQLVGTQQVTMSPVMPTPNNGLWQKSLSLAAGDYDCWGNITWQDVNGKVWILSSNTIRGTVR